MYNKIRKEIMKKHQYNIPLVLSLLLLFSPARLLAESDGSPLLPAGVDAAPSIGGLPDALLATLTYHPALHGKQAGIDASLAEAESARAGRLPTVTLEVGIDDDGESMGELQLNQPLWAFGKIDYSIEHADQRIAVDQADALRIRQDLVEQTVEAYAVIEGLRQRISHAEGNISAHTTLYDQIVSRQEGRLASEADVVLAHSRLIDARSQLSLLQGELRVALNELLALTQVEVDTTPPIDRSQLQLSSDEGLQKEIIERSPMLKYKRQQQRLAKKSLQREEVAFTPTISIRGIKELTDSSDYDHRAMVVFEGRLDGLGFAISSDIAAARARLRASEHEWQVSRSELQRRTIHLLSTREQQHQLVQAYQQSVTALEKTLDSYMRQYRVGRKSWLDVLNIQREVSDQQMKLVQADNAWLKASLTLMVMSGRIPEPALAGSNRSGG